MMIPLEKFRREPRIFTNNPGNQNSLQWSPYLDTEKENADIEYILGEINLTPVREFETARQKHLEQDIEPEI
jgi:hypothetical protein